MYLLKTIHSEDSQFQGEYHSLEAALLKLNRMARQTFKKQQKFMAEIIYTPDERRPQS